MKLPQAPRLIAALGLALLPLAGPAAAQTWENVVWNTPRGTFVGTPGTTLEKSGPDNNWTADVSSTEYLDGDCGLKFTAGTSNKHLAVGFNRGDQHVYFSDLDYSVKLSTNGTFQINEGGRSRYVNGSPTAGSFAVGDEFRIERVGTAVSYYHEGNLVYTSETPSTHPLLVDCSFATIGGKVTGLQRHGSKIPAASVDSRLDIDRDFDGIPNGDDALPGDASNAAADWPAYVADGRVWQNVDWTSLIRTQASETASPLGSTIKRLAQGPNANWNYANATSRRLMPADGAVRFRPHGTGFPLSTSDPCDTYGWCKIGLSRQDSHQSHTDLEYAIYAYHSLIAIYENGNRIIGLFDETGYGDFVFEPGDILEIRREDGVVTYWRNDQKIYTSTRTCRAALQVDTSFYRHHNQFTRCQTTGFLDPDNDPSDPVDPGIDWTGEPWLDGDGDALRNSLENAYSSLDPDDFTDRSGDPDGDGWSSYEEALHGFDPGDPDSPGIGASVWASVSWDPAKYLNLDPAHPGYQLPGVGSGFERPATAPSGWSAGASGDTALTGDFEFRWRYLHHDGAVMIGLSDSDATTAWEEIDYCMYSSPNGTVMIYESSVSLGRVAAADPTRPCSIRRTGTLVEYLVDGEVVYTSTIASTGALYPDVSVLYDGAGIDNAQILDGVTGADVDGDGWADEEELAFTGGSLGLYDGIPPGLPPVNDPHPDDPDNDGLFNASESALNKDPNYPDHPAVGLEVGLTSY